MSREARLLVAVAHHVGPHRRRRRAAFAGLEEMRALLKGFADKVEVSKVQLLVSEHMFGQVVMRVYNGNLGDSRIIP